jgi:beta-galactosidase
VIEILLMSKSSIYFGADYYPEQWPEERWPEDARLMKEAGFNVIRLAEFAWSKMEPSEGKFDFDWLDRALKILHEQGIVALLGTPTASPPPWLMTKHPDIFRVREDGLRVTYGNRCEYCPNHPTYHDHTRRIVTAMAEHYADHPAVIGWQIDNEMGNRCYCPVCQLKFQNWLKVRYGTLEKMNAAWGTEFWSHTYTDWAQIPVPLTTGGSPNPGLALDFRRFISDSYVSYQQMQVDILRQKCPQHFITHNFMGLGYDGLNYYDLARTLDIVSWDNYPAGFWLKDKRVTEPETLALGHDSMRGLKQQNFWTMEQQAGPSGWEIVSPSPRPGELRLWAYQSIAHGADGIVFFRWRTARYGTEQYWHGLLDHHGLPGRRYKEIKQMGAELQKIGATIQGSSVKAKVAILQSYDSRFAFQVQPNNPSFHYSEHVTHVYKALFNRNIAVDVISPQADLSDYMLVIVPALHILDEAVAGRLNQYVQAGGTLVVTPRSGVKDVANAVVNRPLPGLLAEVCGMTVAEYDSLAAGTSQSVKFVIPELAKSDSVEALAWCDILAPKSAEVIARYTDDYYAQQPAITLNRYGKGQAIYVGTFGNDALYKALFGWLLQKLDLRGALTTPSGVEVTQRWQGDRRLLFVLNHTDTQQTITLPNEYIDLFNEKTLHGRVTVAAYEVLVLVSEE